MRSNQFSMEHLQGENQQTEANLARCSKWGRLLAYITFGSVGLSFLQLLFGIIANKGNIAGSIFSFIVSTAITLVLAVNIFNFSKFIDQALLSKDQAFMTQAFTHLKNYFLVIGVIFIILLSLFALFMLLFTVVLIVKS